ncbi:hypothetical protein F5X68DRAFT_231501 [Plectosphaerella plurivora]|uniref:Uncharacterized protein n=1 Tax=Plectosphaerella plurivora TaxID=936078 RepID=A0A9P8VBY2_9PEZI|nr:hypothetical protein F5X68DRAFT_231501 [Plectosphaerella plurivora]
MEEFYTKSINGTDGLGINDINQLVGSTSATRNRDTSRNGVYFLVNPERQRIVTKFYKELFNDISKPLSTAIRHSEFSRYSTRSMATPEPTPSSRGDDCGDDDPFSNPPAPPPAPRVIRGLSTLEDNEKGLCDDLILKLSQRVFSGWKSSYAVPRIRAKIPGRDLSDTSIRVGTLTANATSSDSPSQKRKKALDGSPRSISAARKADQPVYLHPKLHDGTLEMGVSFDFVDARGLAVLSSLIRMDPDIDMAEAVVQVIKHFHIAEAKRVDTWNLSVLIKWARRRVRKLAGHVDHEFVDAAPAQVSAGAYKGENEDDLVQFVSAVARYDKMRSIFIRAEVDDDVHVWQLTEN